MSTAVRERRSWALRHKILVALLSLAVLVAGTVVGWLVYLDRQLAEVPRMELELMGEPGTESPQDADPAQEGVQYARPVTIDGAPAPITVLLGGSDSRSPGEIARLTTEGWRPGAARSDTIMLLHLPASRSEAYLVSIPRDTWVNVPGHGRMKINAAFSLGGPQLYFETVRAFAGIPIDHIAIMDWAGFRQLTDAVGGVEVTVPRTVHDSMNDVTWRAGKHQLDGERAMLYVRQRFGLKHGDFDRINRQQNFLRALLGKVAASETLTNPVTVTRLAQSVAGLMTLDAELDNSRIRELALSIRHLRADDVTFTTVPLQRYDTIRGQSVVIVDQRRARRMFAAVEAGRLAQFLQAENIPGLPGADAVP